MYTHVLTIISLLSKQVSAIDCAQCTFPDSQDPDDVTCITNPPAALPCPANMSRCEAAVTVSMRGDALPVILSFERRCTTAQGDQGCAQAQNTQECQTTCGTDGCLPADPTDAVTDDACSGTAAGGGGGNRNRNTPAAGNGTATGTGNNAGVVLKSSMFTLAMAMAGTTLIT